MKKKNLLLMGLIGVLTGCSYMAPEERLSQGWKTHDFPVPNQFALENDYYFEIEEPSLMHKHFMQAASRYTLERGYTHFTYQLNKEPMFGGTNFVALVQCYRDPKPLGAIDAADFLTRYPRQ